MRPWRRPDGRHIPPYAARRRGAASARHAERQQLAVPSRLPNIVGVLETRPLLLLEEKFPDLPFERVAENIGADVGPSSRRPFYLPQEATAAKLILKSFRRPLPTFADRPFKLRPLGTLDAVSFLAKTPYARRPPSA